MRLYFIPVVAPVLVAITGAISIAGYLGIDRSRSYSAHHVLRLAVPNKTPSTIATEPAATPVKTNSKNVEKFAIFRTEIWLPLSANLR
jgi:hypothetical protein